MTGAVKRGRAQTTGFVAALLLVAAATGTLSVLDGYGATASGDSSDPRTPRLGEIEHLLSSTASADQPTPRVDPDDWLCWDQTASAGGINSDSTSTSLDIWTVDFIRNCSADTFVMAMRTWQPWPTSALDLAGIWIDGDANPTTGCDGFERFVAGGYVPARRDFSYGVVRTPSCETGTWTDIPGARQFVASGAIGIISLEFTSASIGRPRALRWYSVAISSTDVVAQFVPEVGSMIASGYPGGSVNSSPRTAFTVGTPPTLNIDPSRAVTGDFDCDKRGDLYVPGAAPARDYVFWGTRAGGFRRTAGPELGDDFDHLAAGDFNGDGCADLFAQRGVGAETLRMGSATRGQFLKRSAPSIDEAFDDVAAGDFDGDEDTDIVFLREGRDLVLRAAGGNRFVERRYEVLFPLLWFAVGDFDADGDDDIKYRRDPDQDPDAIPTGVARGGPPSLWFWPVWVAAIGANYEQVISGDFDGNGAHDLLLANPGPEFDALHLGVPHTLVARDGPRVVVRNPGTVGFVLDVNGDSRDDVVWVGLGTATDALWLGQTL